MLCIDREWLIKDKEPYQLKDFQLLNSCIEPWLGRSSGSDAAGDLRDYGCY